MRAKLSACSAQLDYGFSCRCARCAASAPAASSWGVVCTACGNTVDGALELRDAPSRHEAIIEPDVEADPLVSPIGSQCFCDCVPCCCAKSQHLCAVITTCSCGHSLLETRTRLQRLLSSVLVWTPPKPAAATMALVSAVESVRSLLPRASAVMLRLLDACCLALLTTLGADARALSEVGRMSWEAADLHREIAGWSSVSEVWMRCRAVKAAAAAGDTAHVLAWGAGGVKMAGKLLGNDGEAVRLMRAWVRCARVQAAALMPRCPVQADGDVCEQFVFTRFCFQGGGSAVSKCWPRSMELARAPKRP